MATVGDRIREKRIELGLSQSELADRIGYRDKTGVSKVETGGNNVTTTKINKFAEALGVTPSYLMGWDDVTTSHSTAGYKVVRPHLAPFQEAVSAAEKAQRRTRGTIMVNNGDLVSMAQQLEGSPAELIANYNKLNPKNQRKASEYVKRLLALQEVEDM